MKPRTRIRRISLKKLAAKGGKMPFSTLPRSQKKIRQVNPEATRKRRLRNQKRMRSPEYKAARAGAIERSGGRCEFVENFAPVVPFVMAQLRCPETTRLQFHEKHYAPGRILTADDGEMLCPTHHRLAEKKKMHKWHRRAFS